MGFCLAGDRCAGAGASCALLLAWPTPGHFPQTHRWREMTGDIMNRLDTLTRAPAVVLAAIAILAGSNAAFGKYDWPQFGFTPDKTGNNTLETAITPSNVAQLKL